MYGYYIQINIIYTCMDIIFRSISYIHVWILYSDQYHIYMYGYYIQINIIYTCMDIIFRSISYIHVWILYSDQYHIYMYGYYIQINIIYTCMDIIFERTYVVSCKTNVRHEINPMNLTYFWLD